MNRKEYRLTIEDAGDYDYCGDGNPDSEELLLFAQAFSSMTPSDQSMFDVICRGCGRYPSSLIPESCLARIEKAMGEFHPDFDKAICDYREWKEAISDGSQ